MIVIMNFTVRERMADMTTVASGAHGHPEVDNMQDLMAQLVDGQTKMMSAITVLTENQVRLQEATEALQASTAKLQASTAELQASTGELARGMALLQADVTLLVARDDSRDDS